jgi:hypothetical protein
MLFEQRYVRATSSRFEVLREAQMPVGRELIPSAKSDASFRLRLIEGIPIDDVVTLLEVRRRFEIPIALCRARAREIAQTAQRMNARRRIA